LLILEILQEAPLEFPTLAAPQREMETAIQPLKKTTANHLRVIFKSNTLPASKMFEVFTLVSGLRNNLQNHRRLFEWRNAATSIWKRVSVRIFKIS
jgi:hypothetical protein